MATLLHTAMRLRQTAKRGFGYGVASGVAAAELAGLLLTTPRWSWRLLVLVGIWVAACSTKLVVAVRRRALEQVDDELALLLLVGAYGLVQLSGGSQSELYPFVYAVLAVASAFGSVRSGLLTMVVALLLEFGFFFVTEGRRDPGLFAAHAAFITFFGTFSVLFTRAEVALARRRSQRELAIERERARDESRLFRLVSPSVGGANNEELLFRSSVDEVHQGLYYVLNLLHTSMELHTCILLLPADEAGTLQIAELVTTSEHVAEGPFRVGTGAVGATFRRGTVTNLRSLKDGYRGICYYRGGSAGVKALLAVPIMDGEQVVGVLCADRVNDIPFDERDEALLQTACRQVCRTMENERVFVQLERSKREQTILYQASRELGTALDEQAVIDAVFRAASDIVRYDFAAVTAYDASTKRHVVKCVIGEQARAFAGLSFRDNMSLTAMAVKNRHYLPYRGDFDAQQQVLYTRKANPKGMSSLVVIPLVVREEPIGTLALGSRDARVFGDSIRATLQVLANQLAVALANAAAVKRLEEMATTDGLTGCLNKRAFTEEIERKITSARRFGRKLSLIVADLDHFKTINDTYGHAMGDRVIRDFGELLRALKRETDIVGRFGGEEFCVLCEETNERGAVQLAQRVRESLAATTTETDVGSLQLTVSLGVATFPDHCADAGALFEAADQALYAAKNRGRNQVCTASPSYSTLNS